MGKQEIKSLLQQAVDVISVAKCWEEEMMCKAQKLGLQGEKRRQRYESTKCENLIKYLRCDAFDTYGIDLDHRRKDVAVPAVSGMKEYFEAFLSKLEELHNVLHTIANKLVMENCQYIAKRLYCKCACIVEDIKYARRTIMEGNMTGWKLEFIMLHQTTAENVHDSFEAKEKEIGYDY